MEIYSAVISGVIVLLLATIARGLVGVRKDVRKFMAEHAWMLKQVRKILDKLDMPVDL